MREFEEVQVQTTLLSKLHVLSEYRTFADENRKPWGELEMTQESESNRPELGMLANPLYICVTLKGSVSLSVPDFSSVMAPPTS